jgi:DNA-binding transcriptional regulator/RsmH inhibitor MraZ
MSPITRTTDRKGRVSLPKEFANTTVLIEVVSQDEIRIRKAVVIPQDEWQLIEQASAPLSDRDRDIFLDLLENPPPPNPALKKVLES